jgi:hypothetical protein
MSSTRRSDEEIVNELAEEAKSLWVAPPGGDELEAKLVARIDAYEATKRAAPAAREVDGRLWGSVALMTALAAGVFFFARPHTGGPSASVERGPSPAAAPEAPLSRESEQALAASPSPEEVVKPRPSTPAELTAVTGGGELRADGVKAAIHSVAFHDGQTQQARGGDAVFAAAGRVDWLLERGTDLSVVRAGAHGGAIVLALQVGAIEAQVVPVVGGEAFAVDVDGVRVAVHGTHLRVARQERGGAHVVVDLSEGVISVGAPPKAGSTVGLLVNAPAHVEFSVNDLDGTLRVDHDPSHVRPAVDPVKLSQSSSVPELAPSNPVTSGTSAGTAPVASPRTPSAPAPKAPTATELVAAAVHKCAEETLHPGEGNLTVSSMLTVDVNPDGSARIANFNPPVKPEFQSCVARTVYSTTWSEPGEHKIPIELHL